jgi:hypothetical protein
LFPAVFSLVSEATNSRKKAIRLLAFKYMRLKALRTETDAKMGAGRPDEDGWREGNRIVRK